MGNIFGAKHEIGSQAEQQGGIVQEVKSIVSILEIVNCL